MTLADLLHPIQAHRTRRFLRELEWRTAIEREMSRPQLHIPPPPLPPLPPRIVTNPLMVAELVIGQAIEKGYTRDG